MPTGTLSDVRQLAESQLGYVEQGGANNNSGNLTRYGKWYGMDAQPWCATFLSWVFHTAGLPLPASTSKGFAYTPSGAAWFQRNGWWSNKPAVGDLVFFSMGGQRIDHVGLVVGVNRDGSIITIEGNTSSGDTGSQRDGGGVYRRTRRSNIVGYGRPPYVQPAPTPTPTPTTPTSEEEDMTIVYIPVDGNGSAHDSTGKPYAPPMIVTGNKRMYAVDWAEVEDSKKSGAPERKAYPWFVLHLKAACEDLPR